VFAEVNERFQDLSATITSFAIASKKAFSNLVDSLLQRCIGDGFWGSSLDACYKVISDVVFLRLLMSIDV
jgi:hypothetical protein